MLRVYFVVVKEQNDIFIVVVVGLRNCVEARATVAQYQ